MKRNTHTHKYTTAGLGVCHHHFCCCSVIAYPFSQPERLQRESTEAGSIGGSPGGSGGGDSSQIPVLNGNLDGSLITFHFVDLVHLTCQSSGSAYDDLSPLVTRMFRTPDSPDQGSRRHPSCVSCPVSLLLCHPFITFSFNYNVNTRV